MTSDSRAEGRAELAEAMMQLAEAVAPMREFAQGQVAYFLGQGYTPKEALAMSAAEFVTVFGAGITRDLPEDWTP
jgi:hypothetical protein